MDEFFVDEIVEIKEPYRSDEYHEQSLIVLYRVIGYEEATTYPRIVLCKPYLHQDMTLVNNVYRIEDLHLSKTNINREV